MVAHDVTSELLEVSSSGILGEIGRIGLYLQALGIVVILWIIFEVCAFFVRRKRMKEIYKIKEDIQRIEGKIDGILKKVK